MNCTITCFWQSTNQFGAFISPLPALQGHATLAVQPLPPGACLPPIELTERGDITNIEIRAFTAGRLVPTIGERLAAAAQKGVAGGGWCVCVWVGWVAMCVWCVGWWW